MANIVILAIRHRCLPRPLLGIAHAPVFVQQGFEQRFGPVECRLFESFYAVAEIYEASFRREVKHAERAGDAQAFSLAMREPSRSSINKRSA